MEPIVIVLAVLLLAVLAAFIVKMIKGRNAKAETESEEDLNITPVEEVEEPGEPSVEEPSDHLAPKSDLDRANEAAAKAKASTSPAPGGGAVPNIPAPPANNSYYGNQPRTPRVTDNDASNAAFLALIAAQQQEQIHLANGGLLPDEDKLSPEDEAKLQDAYDRLVAGSDGQENVTPEPEAVDDGTVEDDGAWVPVTAEDAEPERNDFSYDSSDNASTYNSATDNGSDSGSSSSSSGYDSSSWSSYGSSSSDSGSSSSSSYDSGSSSSSSSSYDSGSSSSSFDSGSSSSGSFD